MSKETFPICHGVQRSRGDIHSLEVEQPIFFHISVLVRVYTETRLNKKAEEAVI